MIMLFDGIYNSLRGFNGKMLENDLICFIICSEEYY